MSERPSAIFHITSSTAWADAARSGELRSSTRDRSLEDEGFIHCSDEHQVPGIANGIYGDADEPLVVLRIQVDRLRAPLRYERLEDTAESFPHVYGPVNADAVVAVTPLHRGPTGFALGEELLT
jgi:uncharacterized protein (DUF952 family)